MIKITHANGAATTTHASHSDAIAHVVAVYGDAVVTDGEYGDTSSHRFLVWAHEADAVDDDGRRAVATLQQITK